MLWVVSDMNHLSLSEAPRPSSIRAKRGWRRMAIRGAIAVGMAVLAALWPQMTLNALVFGAGVYLIVDGVLAVSVGISHRVLGWGLPARGVLAIVLGCLAASYTFLTAYALVITIGLWGIVSGVIELWIAYRFRRELSAPNAWAGAGIVSFLFGMLFLMWPEPTLMVGVLLLSSYVGTLGLALLWLALRLRRLERVDVPTMPQVHVQPV